MLFSGKRLELLLAQMDHHQDVASQEELAGMSAREVEHQVFADAHAEVIREGTTRLMRKSNKKLSQMMLQTQNFAELPWEQARVALKQEHRRRRKRPQVVPTREDLRLNTDRLAFWSLNEYRCESFDEIAEGSFGKVYRVPVFPPIQGARGALFDNAAIKVAKVTSATRNGDDARRFDDGLNSEILVLAQLSHQYIVDILGFTLCSPQVGQAEKWLMILEYCESDVEKLLYGEEDARKEKQHAVVNSQSAEHRQLMMTLALQIARGMKYIHESGFEHLGESDLHLPHRTTLVHGSNGCCC